MPVSESQNAVTRVLVPVSNPQTVVGLLKLASALVTPETGEVIALFILRGDLEQETKTLNKLEPLVQRLQVDGHPVKLQTHKASGIARGILDAARETGSDLIILGVQRSSPEEVILGTIGENVLATASCPVLIYRAARIEKPIRRVVIPTDGSIPARTAAALSLKLAHSYQTEAEAVYAHPGYRSRWEGLARIEHSLESIPGAAQVKRTLISAQNPAQGVLSRLNDDDLLVVGYSGRSNFERLLFGDFSRQMLNRSQCAVVLVAPTAQMTPLLNRAQKRLNRFALRLTPAEQEDITRQAYDLSAANLDYLVLIAIAAMLASLGLLANSAAVIIGAMLVAPFMQPCIAFAVGMTTSHIPLARRALMTLLTGIPLAVAIAALVGLLARGQPFTSEMLARSNPSLLDALVAFASGVMGAYAMARKDIPSALAGVAIAAALMPPLCTFGLSLTAGNTVLGLHAGLLFLTNIVCIALAAWAVFFWLGMRPVLNGRVQHLGYGSMVTLALFILLTIGLLLDVSSSHSRSEQVTNRLEAAFPSAQVREVEVWDGAPVTVSVIVRSAVTVTAQQVAAAEQRLADYLGSPVHLEVVFERVVTAP